MVYQKHVAPGMLIAAPELLGAPFRRSVVLLVEHNDDGALGFIVNRPASLPLSAVLDEVKVPYDKGEPPTSLVLDGGPVSPGSGWIAFEPDGTEPDDLDRVQVSDALYVSSSVDMLHRLAKGQGGKDQVLMLGYAGWDAGQLEDEIRQGAWILADVSPEVLFHVPTSERWSAALRFAGIHPARLTMRTVAQA